jgi:hypothetical protein
VRESPLAPISATTPQAASLRSVLSASIVPVSAESLRSLGAGEDFDEELAVMGLLARAGP